MLFFVLVALTLDTSRNSSHVKQLQMPWWTLYMIFGWSVILRVGSRIEAVGILYPQQTKTTWRVNKHTNSLLGSKNNPAAKWHMALIRPWRSIESASTDPRARHVISHQTCAWYIHVKIPWVLPKNWFYWQLLVPLLQGIFRMHQLMPIKYNQMTVALTSIEQVWKEKGKFVQACFSFG